MGVFAPMGRYYTLKIPTINVGRVGGKVKKRQSSFFQQNIEGHPGAKQESEEPAHGSVRLCLKNLKK